MKFKRVAAYLIDILFVYLLANILYMAVFNDDYQKFVKSSEDYMSVVEKVTKESKNTKSIDKLSKETEEFNYNYLKAGSTNTIIVLSMQILYFIFAQYFNNGQTLGKKILKIRIKQLDEERLNAGLFVLRESLLFVFPIQIIDLICLLSTKMNTYLKINALTSNLELAITLAIIASILFRSDGRGFHELISKTKVVEAKKEEK